MLIVCDWLQETKSAMKERKICACQQNLFGVILEVYLPHMLFVLFYFILFYFIFFFVVLRCIGCLKEIKSVTEESQTWVCQQHSSGWIFEVILIAWDLVFRVRMTLLLHIDEACVHFHIYIYIYIYILRIFSWVVYWDGRTCSGGGCIIFA